MACRRIEALGWAGLPAREQLKRLGAEIQRLKADGVKTRNLENLVDVIIDMDAELSTEDTEMAELWQRK